MRDHVFISYAKADGDEFAQKLYSKLKKHKIDAWLDIYRIRPGEQFNMSLDRGLQEAGAILVLLTKGAVLSPQVESEWNKALNHFTPIFPLLMQPCEIPRVLSVFQYIDFTQSYKGAFSELVSALHDLEESYPGHLRKILCAYLEAQREAPNRNRFKDKIEALRRRIKDFEEHHHSPADRVANSPLLRQSKRTQPVRRKKQPRVRVAGARPPYAAELFKDREWQQKELNRLLLDGSTRMVSIIGRGGMGKTALAATVLSGLEQNGRLREGRRGVDGIAYFSTRTSGISLERLFLDCAAMLGGPQAAALKKVWADPALEPEEKGLRLLKSLSGGLHIILLDNLDDLLDNAGNLPDGELRSLIHNRLHMKSGPRILITSRMTLALPPELSRFDQRVYLQDGLPVADGVALLRDLDPHEKYGLKTESDEMLSRFASLVHGVPRAFEVAVGILANDPFRSITNLLDDFYLEKDVVRGLVKNNYSRIDLDARQVMDAVSVFARPVPAAAVDFLLKPFVPNLDVAAIVNRLLDSHILAVDRASKTITIHPIDRDYVYSQLPESEGYNRARLERSAAAWYRSQQKDVPPYEWESIQELEPNILEFEHLLRAGAHDEAMEALAVFSNYLTWSGHASRAREMIAQLDGKLQSERALMLYCYAKGDNGILYGDFDKSRQYLKDGLALTRRIEDPQYEGEIIYLLGALEKGVGNIDAAIEYYLRALKIHRELGNRESEISCLFDIGLAYAGKRNGRECLRYAQQLEEIANCSGAPLDHGLAQNMFAVGFILSHNWPEALASSQELLRIYKEAKREIWVPAVLNMLGIASLGLGKLDEASSYFESGFIQSIESEHPPYASRCAFNLAWTLYRMAKPGEALSVIEKAKAISEEMREREAINSLSAAVEAFKAGDVGGEIRSLLECARLCQGNVDLWDAGDIASRALGLAEAAEREDLKVQARVLSDDLNSMLIPRE